jgi:hypothetical protein
MSQKILFKRGLEDSRVITLPADGEPVWTTDVGRLYMGDGSTTGGLRVGSALDTATSFTYVSPQAVDATLQGNMDLLKEAISGARTKTPFGFPLSETNRYSIFLFPGLYSGDSSATLDTKYVDLIGVGSKSNVTLYNPPTSSSIIIASGNNRIENVTFNGTIKFDNVNHVAISNCHFNNLTFSGAMQYPLLFTGLAIKDCEFSDIDFSLTPSQSFLGAENNTSLGVSGCSFNDCRIRAGAVFATTARIVNCTFDDLTVNTNSGFMMPCNIYGGTFSNSYVNALRIFSGDSNVSSLVMSDCSLIAPLGLHVGQALNSGILEIHDSVISGLVAVYTGSRLTMSNCSLITTGVSVTGDAADQLGGTGSFYYCRFAGNIATGVTGTVLGNNTNTISTYIQFIR